MNLNYNKDQSNNNQFWLKNIISHTENINTNMQLKLNYLVISLFPGDS